jgi:type II restriction enzyme
MKTNLPIHQAAGYKSPSQIARVVTEHWVRDNMYCPSCDSEHLSSMGTGTRVYDFFCDSCDEKYQLKSQSTPFRRRVLDAAYDPMVDAIKNNKVPTFLFLGYKRDLWKVRELFIVPAHFITLTAIEERKPLRPTARRVRTREADND